MKHDLSVSNWSALEFMAAGMAMYTFGAHGILWFLLICVTLVPLAIYFTIKWREESES